MLNFKSQRLIFNVKNYNNRYKSNNLNNSNKIMNYKLRWGLNEYKNSNFHETLYA